MSAMNVRPLSKIEAASKMQKKSAVTKGEDKMFWISRKKSSKKEDGKFHSKHVKHDPQGESARAVFGLKKSSNSER
jgi:hypothetical protein